MYKKTKIIWTILIIIVIFIIFLTIRFINSDRLIFNENTAIIDLGDFQLLVNKNKITNVIYLNWTGCYLFNDQKITNTNIDESLLTILNITNNYSRLKEISIYDDKTNTSSLIDTLLENTEFKEKLKIYTSNLMLYEKASQLNLDINQQDKKEKIVKLFYDNSNQIKKDVKEELKKENMTYSKIRGYMLRESDDTINTIEDGKEIKIIKKMGEIESKNRIYYCYDIDTAKKSDCFIYDIVNDKKKQISLNTSIMKLNYTDYIDYEATYTSSVIEGNLSCQTSDGNWISVRNYVADTTLEYYPEYLKCITKK